MKITDHIYLVGSGSRWGFGITQEIDCNVYLIDTGEGCIMIDSGTGLEPERMDRVIESHGYTLKDIKALILTHYHGDHACGASRIQKLSGCEIYTSCEPCPMCLGAIYWARLDKVYYACTQDDAADGGFDDSFIYKEIELKKSERSIPFENHREAGAGEEFRLWKATTDKVAY